MLKSILNLVALSGLVSFNAGACAMVLTAGDLWPNSLVITEYLANPVGVSDSQGEYFEIFNTTGFDIDMTDIVVRDDGTNSFVVANMIVGAGSFAVFSSSDGSALGLSPDYVYGGGMSLTNTEDEIGLFRPDDGLISKLAYTDGDFFGAGVAHELAAVGAATPTLLRGPTAGNDFIGSMTPLALGNFGSPGFAGGTVLNAASVPAPAALWMFGSALSILTWLRRKMAQHGGAHRRGVPGASKDIRSSPAGGPDRPADRCGCAAGVRG